MFSSSHCLQYKGFWIWFRLAVSWRHSICNPCHFSSIYSLESPFFVSNLPIFLQSLFWRRSFHYYRFAIFKKPAVAAWDELPGQIRAIIHISKIFLQFFIHNPAPLTDSPLPIILFKVKKYLTSKENRRLALLVRCSKYEVSILRCSLYRADLIHLSYFP